MKALSIDSDGHCCALVIVLLLVATSSAGLGASETTRIDAVSYYGYADYGSQSIKKHSHLTGVYGYLGLGLRHLFEGEVDYTRITYRSRAVLRQWDYTLTYSNFSIRNWKFRVGGHYMTGQDPWADNAWLTIAGAHYYVPYKWDAGVDFYYSRYGKYEPQKLAIQQLTPHLGVNVWTSQRLTVRSDLRGYYIRLGEEVGLQDRDFYSGEARLSLYAGPGSEIPGTVGGDISTSDIEPLQEMLGVPSYWESPDAPNQIAGVEYNGNHVPHPDSSYYDWDDYWEVSALMPPQGEGGVPLYALISAKFLRHVVERGEAASANLIGASFGGTITRYMVANDVDGICSDGLVSRWLTLEGGVNGVWIAQNPLAQPN